MNHLRVGDLAVCVDGTPVGNIDAGLIEGHIYRIAKAIERAVFIEELPCPKGFFGFYHGRFHKIRPDEPKAADSEFVDLLKRIKPKVGA